MDSDSDDEQQFTSALMHAEELFEERKADSGAASQHLRKYTDVDEYVKARNEVTQLVLTQLKQLGEERVSLSLSEQAAVNFVMSASPARQQMCVWHCAIVLSIFLRDRREIVLGKRVLELGCAVAVPSFTAAACGAARVTATDMEEARAAVAQMQRMNSELGVAVTFQQFHWGETHEEQLELPYDIILCSDLVYGDEQTSQLLADALTNIVHRCPGVRVISCYERRWAGDHGASWMTLLHRKGFVLQPLPLPEAVAAHPAAGDCFSMHELFLPAHSP